MLARCRDACMSSGHGCGPSMASPLFTRLVFQVLRWWGFSEEFATEMVFPLTALFFGTGNQVEPQRCRLGLGVRCWLGKSRNWLQWLPIGSPFHCPAATITFQTTPDARHKPPAGLLVTQAARLPSLLQTPHVSAAVIARVFLDPQLRSGCMPRFSGVYLLSAVAALTFCLHFAVF